MTSLEASTAYESDKMLRADTAFFLKKMGWSQEKLDDYLARHGQAHDAFATEKPLWDFALAGYRRAAGPLSRL